MKNSQRIHDIKWKPVELDGLIFKDNADDLIGIEECTDYSLDNTVTGQKTVNKRKSSTLINENVKNKKKKSNSSKKKACLLLSTKGCTAEGVVNSEVNIVESKSIERMNTWESFGLSKSILLGLSSLGFMEPTHIQALTLPPAILGHRDILGAAETGSGKTLAFGLPILAGILNLKNNKKEWKVQGDVEGTKCLNQVNDDSDNTNELYALILTPTRELAIQVKNHLSAVAKFTDVKIAVVVGGMASVKQERILEQCPEIVVATPGRLWELIQTGNSHLSKLDSLRFLVIDETDRMLEKGHFQELHDILQRLNVDEQKSKTRQNFVFSATLTLVHKLPKYLATKKKISRKKNISEMNPEQKLEKIINMLGITDPKIVDISSGSGMSGTLTECRITCSLEEKDFYVYYFLQKHAGRTLIFCNSIGCVKRLSTILSLLQCKVYPFHASMPQRQRLKNLDRFKDNENAVLIATDVAARGLDIPSVEHVIHYQTPRTSESYVHRSGRTARASRHGITVLVMEPAELQDYLRLCKTLGKTEHLPQFPVQENILTAIKERVNLARELDKLSLQVRKGNFELTWFEKAADDMDIILDDAVSSNYDKEETRKYKKLADIKRKQLMQLLQKPLFPKGFSGKYFLSEEQKKFQCSNAPEKAVDVMNLALQNTKKKSRKLFKGWKSQNNYKTKQ